MGFKPVIFYPMAAFPRNCVGARLFLALYRRLSPQYAGSHVYPYNSRVFVNLIQNAQKSRQDAAPTHILWCYTVM